MKKLFVFAAFVMVLTGCGVGAYSVQSGVEDAAYITFTDDVKQEIVVNVDNKTYNVETVKHKAFKSDRDIKHTALNTIKLPVGQHSVSVTLNGEVIYSHKVFLSVGENKIINL